MPAYTVVKKRLEARAAILAAALASPDGQAILRELEQEFFNKSLLGKSTDETMFNLGAREVVVHLRALRATPEGEMTDGRS